MFVAFGIIEGGGAIESNDARVCISRKESLDNLDVVIDMHRLVVYTVGNNPPPPHFGLPMSAMLPPSSTNQGLREIATPVPADTAVSTSRCSLLYASKPRSQPRPFCGLNFAKQYRRATCGLCYMGCMHQDSETVFASLLDVVM